MTSSVYDSNFIRLYLVCHLRDVVKKAAVLATGMHFPHPILVTSIADSKSKHRPIEQLVHYEQQLTMILCAFD